MAPIVYLQNTLYIQHARIRRNINIKSACTNNTIVVTTRDCEKEARSKDGCIYSDERGLNYITQIMRCNTDAPYLHCNSNHSNLFDGKYFIDNKDNLIDVFGNNDYTKDVVIKQLLGYINSEEILLYIHGFNTSNTDAIEQGNILAQTNRTVIVYDWASTSKKGIYLDILLRFYTKDAEAAIASVRPLVWLLHIILLMNKRVHILAHSMGARVAVGALNNLTHDCRLLLGQTSKPNIYKDMLDNIGCIIFKQPDIDLVNMAEFWFRGAFDTNHRNIYVQIFAHDKDRALTLSKYIHAGEYRVGQLTKYKIEEIAKNMLEKAAKYGKNILTADKRLPLADITKSVIIDAYEYCNNSEKRWIFDPQRYINHAYFSNDKFIKKLTLLFDAKKDTSIFTIIDLNKFINIVLDSKNENETDILLELIVQDLFYNNLKKIDNDDTKRNKIFELLEPMEITEGFDQSDNESLPEDS